LRSGNRCEACNQNADEQIHAQHARLPSHQ
jgi:hypothetical protein